jgi:predicted Zn finger-like uncharacterized protein
MIISCNQCNKKFEIDSNLIPNEGRLLQCSSCNHKWFYKKILVKKIINNEETIKFADKEINYKKKVVKENKISIDIKQQKKIKIKKISFLNIILVFIISIIALIIVIDTFKNQISIIIPDIKSILNSLFETLTDVILFLKDLF